MTFIFNNGTIIMKLLFQERLFFSFRLVVNSARWKKKKFYHSIMPIGFDVRTENFDYNRTYKQSISKLSPAQFFHVPDINILCFQIVLLIIIEAITFEKL